VAIGSEILDDQDLQGKLPSTGDNPVAFSALSGDGRRIVTAVAAAVKRFLMSLGARVLDWQGDFIPGRTPGSH
jgi:hypothetical protein